MGCDIIYPGIESPGRREGGGPREGLDNIL